MASNFDTLALPSSNRDERTGLLEVESPIVGQSGWNVQAQIDDSGESAEIVKLSFVRQDHPDARGAKRKGLAPSGTISASIVRSVSLVELVQAANVHLRFHTPKRLRDPAKMRENSPEFYAAWAARYVAAVRRNPRSPVAELAAELGMDRSKVRDRIHDCRARGYLTKGQRGQASGELTELAIEALKKGPRR